MTVRNSYIFKLLGFKTGLLFTECAKLFHIC